MSRTGFGLARPSSEPLAKRDKIDLGQVDEKLAKRVTQQLGRLQAETQLEDAAWSSLPEAWLHKSYATTFSYVGKKKAKHEQQHSAILRLYEAHAPLLPDS
ncbi:uncharacterized protein MONBRDRAFT_29476, partial [Monosiga brevicollis MX1]